MRCAQSAAASTAKPRGRNWPSRSTRIGRGLIALGVAPGDRVAIVGDPSPEWLLADFAAQCIGAISYGLYPTSSRDEAEYVLRHAGASVLIAEDQEHVDKVLPMLDRLPGLRKLVVIDDSNMFNTEHPALLSLAGADRARRTGQRADDFVRRGEAVRPDDPATIVYTSGTSAHPKGALYTHRSLITLGNQFHAFPEFDGAHDVRSVVHLPLNHLYERANTPQGMLVRGIVPHFPDEAERFLETLYEVAPRASCFGAALLVEARLARHRWRREFQRGEARGLPRGDEGRSGLSPSPLERRAPRCARCALWSRPLVDLQSHVEEARPASRAARAVVGRAAAGRGAGALADLGRQPEEPVRPDRMRRGDRAVRAVSAAGHCRPPLSGQ